MHPRDGEPQRGFGGAVPAAVYCGAPLREPGSEGDKEATLHELSCFIRHGCDCGLLLGERWAPLSPRAHPSEGVWGCCGLNHNPFSLGTNRAAVGWAWVRLLGLALGGEASQSSPQPCLPHPQLTGALDASPAPACPHSPPRVAR